MSILLASLLTLDTISYESFVQGEPETIELLQKALHEKGIVGIKGIPGYREKVDQFIETAREFSTLPEDVKQLYAPTRQSGQAPLGYEKGSEQFRLPNGNWAIDDLKATYYGLVPDTIQNQWPTEVDFKTPFQELGSIMSEMGTAIMEKIGLLGPQYGISLDGIPRLGRMLHYSKSTESHNDNPYWCGSHFDHGLFTALLPAFYFDKGVPVAEPEEAGLFIKTTAEGKFQKIVADDPDVLLFQVGEFAQVVTNDAIRATEHRVHKASGTVERYTMALFFDPPMDTVVHSYSELAKDVRYGGVPGAPCTARRWCDESYNRYLVKLKEVDCKMSEKIVRVGVGVIVIKNGKVLMARRIGAHGAGTWQFPGGHLEFGENIEECARRELMEEVGIIPLSMRLGPWVSDLIDGEKHYVTLFVFVDQFEGQPQNLEPDKLMGEWEWFSCDSLPRPLFMPIESLLKKVELEHLIQ